MRMLLKLVPWVLASGLFAPAALASDPLDGTWELDPSASRFDPGPGRKSDIRTYEVDGDAIRMNGTVVFVDGGSEHIQIEAAFDGKEYAPTGNPRVETLSQVRVDAFTSTTKSRRNGKVTAVSTRHVSKDRKTLTITTKGTDQKGVAFNNTLVFRKLESE